MVFLLRLTPLVPFTALNYLLGLTRIRWRDMMLAAPGMLPGTFLYVYYGHVIGDVTAVAAGARPPRSPAQYVLLAVGLVAAALVAWRVSRVARRALTEADLAPAGRREILFGNACVCPRVRRPRPQRHLRGRQAPLPRPASRHRLRPPRDAHRAGHRLGRRRTPDPHRPRSHRRRPGAHGHLRRHLRGPVLLPGADADRRLRPRDRRPPAHRPQPQRHRHDDVPDAASGRHCSRRRRRSRSCAVVDRAGRPPRAHGLRCAHAHAAGAAQHGRALPARRRSSSSSRDHQRLRAAYASVNRNPLGACAITGTGFPIDRERTSELLGFDGPTGNTYGSIATVDYLLESRRARCRCCSSAWAASFRT